MTSLKKSLFKKGYHIVNLMMTADHHLLVSLRVNEEDALFLVDSGASKSCIDANVSEYFNLNVQEAEEQIFGALSSINHVQISKDNKIDIQGWVIKNKELVVIDLAHINAALQQNSEIHIQGILGADLLQKAKALIDYRKERLYLYNDIF